MPLSSLTCYNERTIRGMFIYLSKKVTTYEFLFYILISVINQLIFVRSCVSIYTPMYLQKQLKVNEKLAKNNKKEKVDKSTVKPKTKTKQTTKRDYGRQQRIMAFLKLKIGIPNDTQLKCIEWNYNTNFITAGGTNGVLKVVKLAPIDTSSGKGNRVSLKGLAAPTNLTVNQNLEGHAGGTVVCASWNEMYQKLTTSDTNGLIIVWSLHNESWYEEMINNRNKSMVVGMAWNNEGTRIAIAYQDGQVIVGTMDGSRIWNKELPNQLAACAWSPDGSLLLFGISDGEVHAYDMQGNFVIKLHMVALETVELETALAKDLRKDNIIALKWYAPPVKTKYTESNMQSRPTMMLNRQETPVQPVPPPINRLASLDSVTAVENRETRPKLLVAYEHGVIQLMRNESDTNPIVVRLPQMTISCAQWAPNGGFFAVTGQQMDVPPSDKNAVVFLSAYGAKLRLLKVNGNLLTGCAWDPSGLRVALSIDNNIYFANIRPDYIWGYCGQTVVYAYEKEDRNEFRVIFYETKLEEFFSKPVRNLEVIASNDDYCLLVNRSADAHGTYLLQLCNGIGTPVDFKYTDVEPRSVGINDSCAVIASSDSFYIWHFVVPKRITLNIGLNMANKDDTIHFLDGNVHADLGMPKRKRAADAICCVALADVFFVAVTEGGALFKFSLIDGSLLKKFTAIPSIEKMAFNCTNKRLAVVNHHATMKFFDLTEDALTLVANFERRDIWSFKWDNEKDDSLAVMEKTRMIVISGRESEEPITSSGYICSFKGLTVRCCLVDHFLQNPENPDRKYIIDIEIKALRDAKTLMEKMKIAEATAYIEKNSHPKLWSMLAEVALNRLDLATAEHAYVMLGEYCGLQFCKRVAQIQDEEIRRAEVLAHLGKLDEAEKIFLDNDRRDLAIELRKRVHDWFRVLQILQTTSGPSDDALMQETLNKVGDYFADRQKWEQAAQHYEAAKNLEMQVHCYLMLDDFNNLRILSKRLPHSHPILTEVAQIFGNAGLWEPAVESYLRCDLVAEALDVCIQLNQWEKAVSLSRTHKLRDVDSLLGKYAAELTGSNERTLAAVQLYRRAGKYIEAAKIVFEIADDERRKASSLLRIKKLFVLGALLIEEFREQNRAKFEKPDKENGEVPDKEATTAIDGLLAEEINVSMEDSRLIDNAWRGAEAYHFFMLAQDQLYKGNPDTAMKTALYLMDFDDILDPVEVYSLLALSSCASRQFSVCSRAFMKLDSLPDLAKEEKNAYKKLALTIFTKYPPTDTRPNKVECTTCDAMIPDYSTICPQCDAKIPVCIVTGRPLVDYQFWLCPVCKHRAYEQHINNLKFCLLCHAELS